MRIYLAGPMRGIPEFNFPAFIEGARRLREHGHEVFSPAEHDMREGFDPTGLTGRHDDPKYQKQGFSLREALRTDLSWICSRAEAVALLDGWERSLGAQAERATALALGLPVLPLADLCD